MSLAAGYNEFDSSVTKEVKLPNWLFDDKYNIGYFLLHSRVERLGWDIVEAVETPIVLGRNQYSK